MSQDLYTATVTATDGSISSSDDVLSLDVHEPSDLGGPGGATNPEQLMAAALSSCLLESLRIAVGTAGGSLEGASVEGQVTLSSADGAGYDAAYRLGVTLPGVDNPGDVLEQARSICPFLKTVTGVDVTLSE
ncbi:MULTISPECIES: OsmC family protein [unclassified Rhodococcus (in: high G+C Gram-positive bacteria)]|jgi:Ohr subfamily peroxiredoxin|uniref:OsmC family protein n=1 Tax=unclassified Rhodococcus (in: high G+C Gram-positive bacteria) TaxID=192944 RepID=UPI001C9B21D7|nr:MULTISPECIES: OsmC family protein [unclassified Rhodococcus (in: high G+C Gram-positive bacteria)]MBY6677239.1 OsmC family protein [Rhodococcus sp. BP-332]MBY6684613.1 OsmC family protein [Rhodococcus sp. BP-288]MBY6695420.1 OsmC family protein [Rhodococcus sp. BP-188]MBY6698801.1 OsmC family protein [Rhodococcus sp. BP-285]MBY6701480.1 OsmC family protein [Rhodococcus sp. BP-283]